MRSGHYKESVGALVALTDSNVVRAWTAIGLATLVAAAFVLGPYGLSFLTVILITLTGVLGLHLLTGRTGLISLGHVGFLLLGAYAYAVATTQWKWPAPAGFVLAAVVPAVASLVVGLPSLRLKGLYLAVTTLAFVPIIGHVILQAESVTNGARGLAVQRPVILGVSFDPDARFALLCAAICLLALLATLNLQRTRVGRAWLAIRDNDIAARAMGINLPAYKLLAFATSALFTGVAGALYGIHLSFVSVDGFPFLLSIEALAILIVGGLGSVNGAVLGTVFIVLMPELAQSLMRLTGGWGEKLFSTGVHELRSLLYGLAIILFLRWEPRGLVGLWRDFQRRWIHWPLRY